MQAPAVFYAASLAMIALLVSTAAVCVCAAPMTMPAMSGRGATAFPPRFDDDVSNITFYLYGNKSAFGGAVTLVRPGQPLPAALDRLVTVVYNESFEAIGWDFLQVTPEAWFFADSATEAGTALVQQGYYYAGVAEGLVTATKTVVYYNNTNYAYTAAEAVWIDTHLQFVDGNIAKYSLGGATGALNMSQEALFWRQAGNQWMQLKGLAAGVSLSGIANLAFDDLFRYNFRYEIYDVRNAVGGSSSEDGAISNPRNLHCSALIKVTDKDLFVSHDTWSSFSHMIRQYKVYQFQTTIAMSGYSGQIHSGDDWYITSNALAAQETTNEYFGTALAVEFIKPQCLAEFMRVMVANFLANSGREWAQLFANHASGTYCNQYMVVDYKLYAPGQSGTALQSDLLWIVEEMPGNVTAADKTDVLREAGYWASYNIPYFQNIYVDSGFAAAEASIGDFFSYTKYARPEIFKRNQSDVVDLATMQHMMQLNAWETDPLSIITNCSVCDPKSNPTLAIAARADLVPTTNVTFPPNPQYKQYLQRNPFGATDSKIASYTMMRDGGMQASIFCGPTPQQPVFSWSGYGMPVPHGAVDAYNFTWEAMRVLNAPPFPTNSPAVSSSDKTDLIVGLVVGLSVGTIAAVLIVRHLLNKQSVDNGDYAQI